MHVAYIYKCQSTERHDTCKNYRSGVENILFLTTKRDNREHTLFHTLQ